MLLRLAGCDEMQGYLFAVPGPREALDRLLAGQSRRHRRKLTARRPASIMAETTVQSRERP